jgi:nuclear pore complex protein Nup85
MSSREPWTHASFWPYITRCLLRGFHLPASSFLRTLSQHPHQPISKIGILLATHLSLFPRSHNTHSYPLDHQFLSAHKTWLARFRAEFSAVTAGKTVGAWLASDGGDWDAWGRDFMTVVEIMEGKKERVLEEAADWREAVGAWGILVDVGLRRDDLPLVKVSLCFWQALTRQWGDAHCPGGYPDRQLPA